MEKWIDLSEVTCTDTAQEKRYLDWWDKVHAAEMLEIPGFLKARLCQIREPIDGRGKFMSLFEIETDDINKAITLKEEKLAKELEAEWSNNAFIHIWKDVLWRQIAKMDSSEEHNPELEKWVRFAETWCVPASKDDEFNDWYTNVHLPNVLEKPGYMSATRYKQKELRYGRGTYFSTYELETNDIDKTMSVGAEYYKREVERGEDPGLWVWAWPNQNNKLITERSVTE